MYVMSGSLNAATSLLSQLMADPSGELLQSLQISLDEAIERTAAIGASTTLEPDRRDVINSLQPVFATARDVLDKAAFTIDKVRQGR
ncbi:MAG: hypothetical protein V4739_13105 [Pseudomonadota bacterium]